MLKHFKEFTQDDYDDAHYKFYPDFQGKKVLVLNNVFRKANEINISKAYVEINGASTATDISVYWDSTGNHRDASTLETNSDVIKLDYASEIGNAVRFDVTKALTTILKEKDLQRNERYFVLGNNILMTGITCSITIYYDHNAVSGKRTRRFRLKFKMYRGLLIYPK